MAPQSKVADAARGLAPASPAAPTPSPALPSRRGDRPLLVELVGLAGAGKTTIAPALQRLDPEIRARPRVSWPWHVAGVPPLVPTFASLHWPFRGVLTNEMKSILRLRALYRVARNATGCRVLLFDEGPVYMLARTLVYGGKNIQTRGFARWWRRAIAQWAATLDVIVWLDAPDEVLSLRIHSRPKWHPLQGASDQMMAEFLRSYRQAFSRVLADLTAARQLQLWTVPTDRGSADLRARELLARFQSLRGTADLVRETA
jgi:predicted kinase